MLRLTDKDFKYTPAAATDLRKTFARVRREIKRADDQQKATQPRAVLPLKARSK